MSTAILTVATGRRAAIAQLGDGQPVLYLHDFIDVHGATPDWLPVHHVLAKRCRLIALAHAGCAGSDEDEDAESADDVVMHVLEALDAMNLRRIPVVGVGVGGWIAAELAVRHPDIVERLVLLGATGLFIPDQPIADIFYASYPVDGSNLSEMRQMLFVDADSDLANEFVPDGRMSMERESLRYLMFRFANRLGFKPPYLYNRQLIRRLRRYTGPALVLWGERDRFVPLGHARAYAANLGDARLHVIPGAGHSAHVERADDVASEVLSFLES